MKVFFSIIIPYHNSSETIGRLLGSIQKSKKVPSYEVIVVDDGSTESVIPANARLAEDPAKRAGIQRKKHWIPGQARNDKILRLSKNMGPAVARNRGVNVARGKFVVFLDSDVELFPDSLYNLYKIYKEDPDVVAVTGVWVKEQRSKDFFPNYKALRDWSYWINERDKSGYYFLFSTRIASIKKTVFQRLGGFDETYPAPLVEDIELTYRIARRYAIIFAPNVRVRHEFEPFWPVAKKYFLRAYYWTRLYQKRKKFDPVATTLQEALTTVSGVAVVFFLLMSLMSPIGRMSLMVTLLLHLFLTRKFLAFMVQEKGIIFAIKGFFMGLILSCFIFAGALAGRLKHAE
ncbi:glycosyltransferase family 2 protein [Candidatus Gottesmanbacteria bacterium]|nr:glycosyltransferase family 2 protein [Candidatus Gottesmanbacteria bacterium]